MKLLILVLSLVIVSCNSSDTLQFQDAGSFDQNMDSGLTGPQVFMTRTPDGNLFSCQNCHTADNIQGTFITAGHDITDAYARSTYKNGQLSELRDAVNNCVEHWMLGSPWGEDHPRWQALSGWLEEISPESANDLVYNIIQPPSVIADGEESTGRNIFNNTCAGCHGFDGRGSNIGPSLIGHSVTKQRVAERIRLAGPQSAIVYAGLTGGRMPFWSEDKLSNAQLTDVVAYVQTLQNTSPPPPPPPTSNVTDISVTGAQTTGQCGNNHPSVGRQTSLSTFSHQVQGTVEIIDNCTIEIRNFIYDGGGIDVRMYSGVNGNYFSGRAISRDIFRTRFQNETIRIRLPQGVSLNQFNGISVWCVAVGSSFGDGQW